MKSLRRVFSYLLLPLTPLLSEQRVRAHQVADSPDTWKKGLCQRRPARYVADVHDRDALVVLTSV